MKFRRNVIGAVIISLVRLHLSAQELTLTGEDLIIDQTLEGGYDLYVRSTKGIRSILLTESSADPEKSSDSYALRTTIYHGSYGEEMRLLDGEFISIGDGSHSLIDSTPEPHPVLGQAFHLFIPYVVIYGYSWGRNGQIQILDGTWIGVRTFEKPYADYTGAFKDNPFMLRVVQQPITPPRDDRYMDATVETYEKIARDGGGNTAFSPDEERLVDSIETIVAGIEGESLDLMLVLDATASMVEEMKELVGGLVPMLEREGRRFDSFRCGIVLYKDYFEDFLTRVIPLRKGTEGLQRVITALKPHGGRDIPEAVYEALYTTLEKTPWNSTNRAIILAGDAPPHPIPRGNITREMVIEKAEELGVSINTIILPH